jgi:hypothetical protein
MFLKALTEQVRLRSHRLLLQGSQIVLGVTFVGVLISTIAECRPTTHYWQVFPDPGPSCRQAPAQFITLSTAHVITNLMLVAFPIPIIVKANITVKRKIITLALLSLPMLNVAYTLGTITMITDSNFVQHTRSLVGSLDMLLNAAWSNAVVLCALLQDKGFKKPKYKPKFEYNPNDKSHFTTAKTRAGSKSTARDPWDSDEELIAGETMDGGSTRGETSVAVNAGGKQFDDRHGTFEMRPLPPSKAQMNSGSIRVAQTWEVAVEERVEPSHR